MKPLKTIALFLLFLVTIAVTIPAAAQLKPKENKTKIKKGNSNNTGLNKKNITALDIATIERIMGTKGITNNGEYKIVIPQNDLSVVVDGFTIIPAMGLSSWIAFTPLNRGAMIMGDIIVTETDLKPVEQEIIRQGLTISAIHNHFVRNHPTVMFMHLGGSGATALMAQKAKAVLDKIKEVRGGDPAKGSASLQAVTNTLDVKRLNNILGYKADIGKGVYKYTIGRPDVSLHEHGVRITTFLGFNTWAAFQGTPDHAAVAGDFTMLENEVDPVVKTLIENGIEVVALHNHMVHERPRIFFLHYWGVGNAEQLAKGLKAALDQTGKKKPGMLMKM